MGQSLRDAGVVCGAAGAVGVVVSGDVQAPRARNQRNRREGTASVVDLLV